MHQITTDLTKAQIAMELKYSKKHVREFVKEDLLSQEVIRDKIYLCLQLIEEWQKKDHYESKKERIQGITREQAEDVIIDVMALLSQESRIQALTGVIGRCHTALEMEYLQAIKTVGELTAIMCEADLVDIYPSHVSPVKINDQAVVAIAPVHGLSEETSLRLQQTMHLPPMIAKPRKIVSNDMSGYYCGGKPVILGRLNQHKLCASLDVINNFNSTPFSLDIEFLQQVKDVLKPSKKSKTKDLTKEQHEHWEKFINQSNHVYIELIRHGNKFYFNHHVDLNGRVYTEGYHCNPQGKGFLKAILNFYHGEKIEVEDEYKDMFL